MVAYANVHMALEAMRVRALAAVHGSPLHDDSGDEGTDPPRVLVLGPENSGKTSMCKILTSYAVRTGQDWTPMFVNVDSSEVRVRVILSLRREVRISVWCSYTYMRVAGRMGCPWSNLRCVHRCTLADVHPGLSAWCGGNVSTEPHRLERAPSAVLLVRPCGDAAESAPPGPTGSESGRKHPRQIRRRHCGRWVRATVFHRQDTMLTDVLTWH